MGVGLMCKPYTWPVSLTLSAMKPQPLFRGMFSDSSHHLREAAFTTSHLTECCKTPKYKYNGKWKQDGASEKKHFKVWRRLKQLPDHRRQLKTARDAFTQSGSGDAVRRMSQPRNSQRTRSSLVDPWANAYRVRPIWKMLHMPNIAC